MCSPVKPYTNVGVIVPSFTVVPWPFDSEQSETASEVS